jgi:hypothetical protein
MGILSALGRRPMRSFLDAMPVSWPIAIQAVRLIGAGFLLEWSKGTVPGVFAWEAGTLDILVGLTAIPVGWLCASRASGVGYRLAVAWNLLGLGDMVAAMTIAVLFGIAPALMGVDSSTQIAVGTYPLAMTATFGVPTALIFHGLSLWQLNRRIRVIPHGGAAPIGQA